VAATGEVARPGAAVVLAGPPWVGADLLPGQSCPTEFQAILNIHFRVEADPGPPGFIGLVGGTAEWVFAKRGHVSVTISAANRMVDQDAAASAEAVWPDVRAALDLEGRLPAGRVVKERRATVAATAAQERLRPGARTDLTNLVLAGDWTATGRSARPKVPSGPAEPRPRCCSPPEDAQCRVKPCCRTRSCRRGAVRRCPVCRPRVGAA
jgi:hypothetical protein